MPTSRIVSVTIEHVWDDESVTEFKVTHGYDLSLGPHIEVASEGAIVSFKPESWPDIRDQIEALFAEMPK